jgi:hypothetical protein
MMPLHRRLSIEDRNEVLDYLECDLSPENLACDGELSRSDTEQRRKYFNKLKREVKSFNWP